MEQKLSAALTTTFHDIEAAAARIKGAVYESPCPQSIPLSELTGIKIHCKLDNLQRTGASRNAGRATRSSSSPPNRKS